MRESRGDCVTTKEGIFLPRLHSCPAWGWPALFSLPDLFSLSTLPLPVFALRAHALVHWYCCSPTAKKSSTKVHWDKSADLFPEKRKVKQTHIWTMSMCQSKYLSSKTDTSTTVHPLRWSKARKKSQRDWVGFLAVLPWKPLFCPLPSCLTFLHTMRWKVNCLSTKADWSGVWKRRGWRLGRLKDAQELKKHARKKAEWSWNRWSMFTHWSFCFLRAACYLISGRQI